MVSNYLNPPLTKVSETISESAMAREEYANTKMPRLFRESKMQDVITDALGFDESNSPSFHKNKDPELKGSNAYYDPRQHEIHYDSGEWTPGILAHEIGHSTMGISPLSKAMNIGGTLAAASALPLAIAADSSTASKYAPTLYESLTASGGLKNKLKLLKTGLKGRGSKWAVGAAVAGGLATLAEEARASLKGAEGIEALEDKGVLSEEQADLAKNTMRNAYMSYLLGVPLATLADIGTKNYVASFVPSKFKMPLAAGLGALGALGVAQGYGYLNAYNPISSIASKHLHSNLGEHND